MKRGGYNRREDKKELLVAFARELISRKGYREVTVSDITEAAGLGKGTFYLYFESKEALFREVIKDAVRHLRVTLGEALRDIEDPRLRVLAAVPVIFEVCHRNAGLYLAIFQETAQADEDSPEGYKFFFTPMVRDFRQVIEEGVRRGVFHVRNPEVVAHGMIGLMASLVHQWLLLEERGGAPEGYLEEMSDTIAGFCLNGLAGKPTPPDPANIGTKSLALCEGLLEEIRSAQKEMSRAADAIETILDRLKERLGGNTAQA